MTQRLLAEHPSIYTRSETWMMLSPVLAMKEGSIKADYDHETALKATKGFLELLPKGEDTYWDSVGRAYGDLYRQALAGKSESIYLDKTPRYYLIIDELNKIFPKAKQFLLVRNPISVLSSVCKTWCSNDIGRLAYFQEDLHSGPKLMSRAIENQRPNQRVVRYEELVVDPKGSVSEMYNWVGLPSSETAGSYRKLSEQKWQFGDQVEVNRNSSPKAERVNAWKKHLQDPNFWRLANDYVESIGEHQLRILGYPLDILQQELSHFRPSKFAYWRTKPLRSYMTTISS